METTLKTTSASGRVKLAVAVAGAFLFQFLFWQEYLGLNLLLYLAAIVFLLPVFYPHLRQSKSFVLVASGTLLAGIMVVVNNSVTAKFAVFASFLLMLGLANQPQIRLLFFAAANGVLSLWHGIRRFFSELVNLWPEESKWRKAFYYAKLTAIPLGALLVFHLLFTVANARYDALTQHLEDLFVHFLDWLLPIVLANRILVILLGLFITAGSLFLVPLAFWKKQEAHKSDDIHRKSGQTDFISRLMLSFSASGPRPMSLKKEYLSALLLLGLVNALLLCVNIIDINWLWFGFELEPGFVLSQFVHEGTYVLIYSILLAMAIVLFYFRGNLNFYQHNQLLKWGAYAWIVQNAILAISVGLRNYYYIYYCGLAYKRIGVLVFLLLTLFGLASVYLKISRRKSFFYLLRTNTVAAYVLMLVLTCVNWDPLIARVNITHPNTKMIDYNFLLTLSGKALPVLYANEQRLNGKGNLNHYPRKELRPYLHTRIQQFLADYEQHSWRSWNAADSRAYQYLKANYKPESLSVNSAPDPTALSRSIPAGNRPATEDEILESVNQHASGNGK